MDVKQTDLFTVPLRTVQFLIRETININVRTTEVSISSPSNSTLRMGQTVCHSLYV